MLLGDNPIETGTGCPGTSAKVCLRVRGEHTGDRLIELGSGRTTIGSSPRCDLQLLDGGVQPLHVLVVTDDEGVHIRRWAAGALINGRPFDETILAPGDCLTVGTTTFEIEAPRDDSCELQPSELVVDGRLGVASTEGGENAVTVQKHDGMAPVPSIARAATVHDAPQDDSKWADSSCRHHGSASRIRDRKVLAAVRRSQQESRRLSDRVDLLEQLVGTIVDDWQIACHAAPSCGEPADASNLMPSAGAQCRGDLLVDAADASGLSTKTTAAPLDIAALANKTDGLAAQLAELSHDQKTLQGEVQALRREWAAIGDGTEDWQQHLAQLGQQIGEMQALLAQFGPTGAAEPVRAEPAEEAHLGDGPVASRGTSEVQPRLTAEFATPFDQVATPSEHDWSRGGFGFDSPVSTRSGTTTGGAVCPGGQPGKATSLHDSTGSLEVDAPYPEVDGPASKFDWAAMTSKRPSTWMAGPESTQYEQGCVELPADATNPREPAAEESAPGFSGSIATDVNPWAVPSAAASNRTSGWPLMEPTDAPRSLEGSDSQNEQIREQIRGDSAQPEWERSTSTASNGADQRHEIDDDLTSFDEFSLWNRGARESQSRPVPDQAEAAPQATGNVWQTEVDAQSAADELESAAGARPALELSTGLRDNEPAGAAADRSSLRDILAISDAGTLKAGSAPTPKSTSSFIEKYAHMFDDDGPSGVQDSLSCGGRDPDKDVSDRHDESASARRLAAAAATDGRPMDDEESIEQYMAKLLQRVRGDGPVIAASQAHPASPNRELEDLNRQYPPPASAAVQGAAAGSVEPAANSVEGAAGEADLARRAIPPAEQAANLEAFRALANESARRAIGKHASGVHRRDAVTKAIVATLAGMTSIWLMLDAPHWLDLQFLTACVSFLVAAYWAGQAYGTLIEAYRAVSYHGPRQDVPLSEDPFHPRLPIDVDRT